MNNEREAYEGLRAYQNLGSDEMTQEEKEAAMGCILFPFKLIWFIICLPFKLLKFAWNVLSSWRTLLTGGILSAIVLLNPIIVSKINYNGFAVNQNLWIAIAVIITLIVYRADQRRKFLIADQEKSFPQTYWEFRRLAWMATLGNTHAQRKFADCYFYGHGVKGDYMKAMLWYRKASDKGSLSAKLQLAEANINGYACFFDYGYADKLLVELADKGYEDAIIRIYDFFYAIPDWTLVPGEWHYNRHALNRTEKYGGIIKKKKIHKGIVLMAIKARNTEAIFNMKQDAYKALKVFADQGDPDALLAIINDSHVLPEDLEKYTKMYEPHKKAKEELEEKNRKASEAIAERLPKRFNKSLID